MLDGMPAGILLRNWACQGVNVGCPGSAIVAVGIVSWMLMGSLWAAATLAAVITALLVQLAGLLPVLGMQLNAVSLVNLAMVCPCPNEVGLRACDPQEGSQL